MIRPVTILMPIYNGIEFLEESLASVQAQFYTNWNLYIGINGHPERSAVYQQAVETVVKLGMDMNKVYVMDLPDIQGKSAALNEMMKCVLSPYVGLLDVDDIWLPDKLEKQMPFLLEQGYSVVGTSCVYFGDPSKSGIIPKIPLGNFDTWDFLASNPIINSSVVFKRELGHWKTEWDGVEDYGLWLDLWYEYWRNYAKVCTTEIRCRYFYNVNQILVKHRIHSQSAYNSSAEQQRKLNLLLEQMVNKMSQ